MNDFREGKQIGAYVLEKRLGGGSFGEVWRGHEVESGRPVAVKVLTGMLSSPDTAAMRAEVETLAAAAASRSEHIVHVLGGGSDPVPYIVMEYIEGSDLSALLADGGKLSAERTIDVGLAISSALGALNEAGIVHRDIKPANVMVDTQGKIKLADFGIAKIVGYETMTMTGQAAMTMAYAAPEVWDDDSPFGRPSHRSDLYAMGILLYQCLTGETPFRGNYGALYRQHTERPPDLRALPADVPPSLRALVRKCLEKKQADRPAGSAECNAMLGRARAEIDERRKGRPSFEPAKFGSWNRGAPHQTQPWAWYCTHETSGETALVEVQFAVSLEHGADLRRAVNSISKLTAFGAERLLQTNRLLMHPGESWVSPPDGQYQFWVARQEQQPEAASVVTLPMLAAATVTYGNLLNAAQQEGVRISPLSDDFTVLASGAIYVERPGVASSTTDPQDQALVRMKALPLDNQARDFIANAATFPALLQMAQALQPQQGHEQRTIIAASATVLNPQNTVISPPAGPESTVIAPMPDAGTVIASTCVNCHQPLLPGDRWCATCGHQVGAPLPAAASGTGDAYRIAGATGGAALAGATTGGVAAGALAGLQVEMRRVSSRGATADYEVMLYNTGRHATPVNLYAYDQGDQLAYTLPQQIMLAEGAYERVGLHVEARKRRMFGGRKKTPFTVAAAGGGGMDVPVTAEGEFDEEPSKLPLLAGGVMGVAAAALLAFLLMSGGGDNNNGNAQVKSGDKPAASGGAMADFTPVATASAATPLAVDLPPTPTPVPPPTATPEPPPPPSPTPVPPPPPPPTGGAGTGGAGGAGAGGGGNTGGGGGGAGPVVVQPPVPTPIPPPPPTPVPQRINIATVTCTSSLGNASASNAGPAASQTVQLAAAPNDTIRCTANVTGDYTSLVWTGPSGGGNGSSFTAQIGGAKPGGVPYTIGLQANWSGNPAIVNFAINVNTNLPSAGGNSKCTQQGTTQVCIN